MRTVPLDMDRRTDTALDGGHGGGGCRQDRAPPHRGKSHNRARALPDSVVELLDQALPGSALPLRPPTYYVRSSLVACRMPSVARLYRRVLDRGGE
jgi:hypothetical protein